uniref:Cyclic nucleotide-binding domain-containing protein n=1 Tax=Alexandrium catenella TaxID=2925 RepID=A0A7S1S9F4_ALECA
MNAMVAFPECREAVLENETWRMDGPQLNSQRVFQGVPAPVLSRVMREAGHKYFRQCDCILHPGVPVEEGSLMYILRGEARISILGLEVRTLKAGDIIGLHKFLKLPQRPLPSYEIIASAATDVIILKSGMLFEAVEDDRFEDEMKPFQSAVQVLSGGDILDAFGLKVAGQEAKFLTDCVEQSEVFRVCSMPFVAQLAWLVEDLAFFPGERIYSQGDEGFFMFFIQAGRVRLEVLGRPKHEVVDGGTTLGDMACLKQVPHYTETAIAETHVWVRALHRRLLERALVSFPEEERRVMGQASGGQAGVFEDD